MGETVAGLVGVYDNLSEPTPLANHTSTVLGVLIPFQILAIFCSLLRLWTRFRVIKAPGWDDACVALSLISATLGSTVVCLGAARYGLGKHFLLLGGPKAMATYLKGFYVGNGSYILSTTFIKMALLLQYLRVLDRGFFLYRFSFFMTVVVGLWGLAFAIVAWFPCSPISDFWSLSPEANCWGFASQNPTTFLATFEIHAALNLIFDLVVLGIPVHVYLTTDVRDKTRWGLLGVLLLGCVANLVCVWRLVTIIQHKAATYPTFDPSWYGCESFVLAAVEIDMAVVCATVPVFWPVLQSTGFQIFITKEVKVTSENRLRSIDDDAGESIELQYAGAMPAGSTVNRPASIRSKDGSEEHLHKIVSSHSERNRLPYYDDKLGLTGDDTDPAGGTRWTKPGTRVSISANRDRAPTG